tara:strand:- start:2679 stop:3047 length:369 start_codon:yes stop_codon:yes gene_type:complete
MKSRTLPGDISLYDEAVILYNTVGIDFNELIMMHHLNGGVVISTPLWFLMGMDIRGEYWQIGYAAAKVENPIKLFMDLAPYRLDKVAISRYRDIPKNTEDVFRFYSWERLYNKVKNYGSNGH